MSLFDSNAAAVVDSIAAVFSDDAVYTPAGGGPVNVRIVLGWIDDPPVTFPGLDTQARSPGLRGQVAQADLPGEPTAGDTGDTLLVVTGKHAGATLRVRDCFADVERSQWTLDLSA